MAKKKKKAKPAKKAARPAKPVKKVLKKGMKKPAPISPFRRLKASRKPAGPTIVMKRHSDLIVPVKVKETTERPLTSGQIQELRETLLQKREELLAVVQRKKEQEIQVGEVEIGDEADIATRSVEKDLLFETTDTEKQTLDEVEAALRRIEKGVYGRCESCMKSIPKMRLEYTPWARYCISCQAGLEVPGGSTSSSGGGE